MLEKIHAYRKKQLSAIMLSVRSRTLEVGGVESPFFVSWDCWKISNLSTKEASK